MSGLPDPPPAWWQDSDGNWWPPEAHPARRPPPTLPPALKPPGLTAESQWSPDRILILASAIVVAVGSLLPWATVSAGFLSVSVNGTDGDGAVTLVCGIAAAALVATGFRRALRGLTLVAFAVAAATSWYDKTNIERLIADIDTSLVQAAAGIGLWMVCIASATGGGVTLFTLVGGSKLKD